MRSVAAQALLGRQPASESTQLVEYFLDPGLTPDEHSAVVFQEIDLITLLQAELPN